MMATVASVHPWLGWRFSQFRRVFRVEAATRPCLVAGPSRRRARASSQGQAGRPKAEETCLTHHLLRVQSARRAPTWRRRRTTTTTRSGLGLAGPPFGALPGEKLAVPHPTLQPLGARVQRRGLHRGIRGQPVFFGRSTGMVQPLAEGQLTPPPGWMRGLGEEQALVASRGGYPQGARQHRRPARRRFDRRAAPCCDAGQHLRATSGERTHTRPRLVAGPAMTCDTARLARRVGTGSTDYKVLIKKLRDASTRVSSATTPAHCGAGV